MRKRLDTHLKLQIPNLKPHPHKQDRGHEGGILHGRGRRRSFSFVPGILQTPQPAGFRDSARHPQPRRQHRYSCPLLAVSFTIRQNISACAGGSGADVQNFAKSTRYPQISSAYNCNKNIHLHPPRTSHPQLAKSEQEFSPVYKIRNSPTFVARESRSEIPGTRRGIP
jgi:hypothetical protein